MTTSLAELLREATESRLKDVFTAAIGSVVSYATATQTAQVQLVTRLPLADENGELQYLDFPIIQDVPICFMRAGNYSITFPIQQNDTVLVVFTSLDSSKWRDTGNVPTNPQTVKLHSLGHGFALPLVAPRDAALPGASEQAMVISGDEIRIGAATSAEVDAVALAEAVEKDNDILFDAISNAGTTPNDGGAAFKTAILAALVDAGYPNSVGSPNVKAKK